ncbi:TetR/AcrR family transcriptional regulator [Bremerella cremea]|uniref:TetR/AcrR family transcriptional regulator n=1 Tax=Bremerella cremea TaxID=1031537 RepID=UPI0031E57C53
MEKQDDASRKSGRPGRPRNEATHQAVLEASLRLTELNGYSRLTIEGIAAEAGVGKQTIYRWWPSKAAVVLEAFAHDARSVVRVRTTGDLESDLAGFLGEVHARFSGPRGTVLRSLLAEMLIDGEFAEEMLQQYLIGRVDDIKLVLSQRKLSTKHREQVIEMIYGAIWFRLVTRQPLTAAIAKRLAAMAVTMIDGLQATEAVRKPKKKA